MSGFSIGGCVGGGVGAASSGVQPNVSASSPIMIVLIALCVFAQPVGFVHRGFTLDLARMPYARTIDHTFDCRAVEAVEEPLESVDRALHNRCVVLGGRGDEVELLVAHLGVTTAAAIDQGFHLRAHRVEVDRRCHNDDVGGHHFVKYGRHIILLRARLVVQAANAASGAVIDAVVGEEDFFDLVSRFCCAAHKLITQGVRVAATARRRAEN